MICHDEERIASLAKTFGLTVDEVREQLTFRRAPDHRDRPPHSPDRPRDDARYFSYGAARNEP